MTIATAPKNSHRSRFKRLRGGIAALAVVGFVGTAVLAPSLGEPGHARADEQFFAEREYQRFTPVGALPVGIHLATAPLEELLPEPEPEPEPTPAATGQSSAPQVHTPMYAGGGNKDAWLAASGIPSEYWAYVDFIVSKESGWNPNAVNASSGASGLVQALPCSKVPGNCFDPVDNLRWANTYATSRYGGWPQAYAFWSTNRWW